MTLFTLTIKDGRRILTKMSGVEFADALKQVAAQQTKIEAGEKPAVTIEVDSDD